MNRYTYVYYIPYPKCTLHVAHKSSLYTTYNVFGMMHRNSPTLHSVLANARNFVHETASIRSDEQSMRRKTVRNCDRCKIAGTHFIFDSISDSPRRHRRHSVVDCQIPKQIRMHWRVVCRKIHFMSMRTLSTDDYYESLSVSCAFRPSFLHSHAHMHEKIERIRIDNKIGGKKKGRRDFHRVCGSVTSCSAARQLNMKNDDH